MARGMCVIRGLGFEEVEINVHHEQLEVSDYSLEHTLGCGQEFLWGKDELGWRGVIKGRLTRLREVPGGLEVGLYDGGGAGWFRDYLQADVDLQRVVATFPRDRVLMDAVSACRGLRLLRQDPWECLAGFILSSTKQIVQIRQIVQLLCERHGRPVTGSESLRSFPSPETVCAVGEAGLRACRMGFRAASLLGAARAVVDGKLDLEGLGTLPTGAAREQLMALRGVGQKIADCVLLFAYGRQDAFPVDVWVARMLQVVYFPRRKPSLAELREFSSGHFGPYGGYAQQYLFHYARTSGAGLFEK